MHGSKLIYLIVAVSLVLVGGGCAPGGEKGPTVDPSACVGSGDAAHRTGTVVASNGLNVRDKPGGKRLGALAAHAKFNVLGEQGGWLHVEAMQNGRTLSGWISGKPKYVRLEGPAAFVPGMVFGDPKNWDKEIKTALDGLFGGGGNKPNLDAHTFDVAPLIAQLGGTLNTAEPLNLTMGSVWDPVLDVFTLIKDSRVERALVNFDVAARSLRLSQDMLENARIGSKTAWPERAAYAPGRRNEMFEAMLESGHYDLGTEDLSSLIRPLDVATNTLIDQLYRKGVEPTLENGYKGKPDPRAFGDARTGTHDSVLEAALSLVRGRMPPYEIDPELAQKYRLTDRQGGLQATMEPDDVLRGFRQARLELRVQEKKLAKLEDRKRRLGGKEDKTLDREIAGQQAILEPYKRKFEFFEEGLEYYLDDGLESAIDAGYALGDEQQPLARNLMLASRMAHELSNAAIYKTSFAFGNLRALPDLPREIGELVAKQRSGRLVGGQRRIDRLKKAAMSMGYNIDVVKNELLRQRGLAVLVEDAMAMVLGAKFKQAAGRTYLAMNETAEWVVPGTTPLLAWPDKDAEKLTDACTHKPMLVPSGTRVDLLEVSNSTYYDRSSRGQKPFYRVVFTPDIQGGGKDKAADVQGWVKGGGSLDVALGGT